MSQYAQCGGWASNGLGGLSSLGSGDIVTNVTNVTIDNIQYVCTPTASASVFYPKYLYHQNTPATFTTTPNIPYEAFSFYNAMMGNLHYQTGVTAHLSSLMGNSYQTPETPEQAAARLKLIAEQEAKRKAASMRAEHLLFTILTPSQVKQFRDDMYVEQEIGGRIYRLHGNSRSGNVVLMENGKPKFKYCAHPKDAHDVPIQDVLLSQLLMLKTNEQEFLRLANRTAVQ